MFERHAAQLPQGVLQAAGETLERFRKTDGASLPVRIGQREVIKQMGEELPGQGDLQLAHVGEVGLSHQAWGVLLRKENLFWRSVLGMPGFDAALQGAQMPGLKLSFVLATEKLEDSDGFQGRLVDQQLFDFGPDFLESINAR